MRTALERHVVAVAELARLEAHDAPREPGYAVGELHRVVEAADREELCGAAVELRTEHLDPGHDLGRLALGLPAGPRLGRVACGLPGLHRGMARYRRMVAVVLRQVGEQRLHALAIVVEPDHVAPDLWAVRGDGVAKPRVAQAEERLVVARIERQARAVDELLDRLPVFALDHAAART